MDDRKGTKFGPEPNGDDSVEPELPPPRTRMPAVAGAVLIIAMILTFLTAWQLYYTAENVAGMEGTGTIRGIIKESYLGKTIPVRNVLVSVDNTNLSTYTDSAGYYKLNGVPVGVQKIRFEKPGYERAILKAIIYATNEKGMNNFSFPSPAGAIPELKRFVRDIDIITPTFVNGTISIKLVNTSAQPLQGSDIYYFRTNDGLDTQFEFQSGAKTTEAGEALLNLTPGKYILNITHPGYRHIRSEAIVSPGRINNISFTLVPGSGLDEYPKLPQVEIHGLIRTPEGEPIKDVLVKIEGTNISTVSDVSGLYSLPYLSQGLKTLSFLRPGYSALSVQLFLEKNTTGDYNLSALGEQVYDSSDLTRVYQCTAVYIIVGLLLLVGGLLAFRRSKYGVVMVISIIGMIGSMPMIVYYTVCLTAFLCVIAVVCTYFSRKEFR